MSTINRSALDFDRSALDFDIPRERLIMTLQDASEALREGKRAPWLESLAEALIEDGVWNADELQRLHAEQYAGDKAYYMWHGALRRSLMQVF